MLTKTVAVHYAKQKIRCNCISSAGVETPCWKIHRSIKARFEGLHPLGRLGQPEEIGDRSLFCF